jgi:hypothetical protein
MIRIQVSKNIISNVEIYYWCKDNNIDDADWKYFSLGKNGYLYFENDEDALAFKLTFGL